MNELNEIEIVKMSNINNIDMKKIQAVSKERLAKTVNSVRLHKSLIEAAEFLSGHSTFMDMSAEGNIVTHTDKDNGCSVFLRFIADKENKIYDDVDIKADGCISFSTEVELRSLGQILLDKSVIADSVNEKIKNCIETLRL